MEAKTRKVLDICEDGCHLECVRINDRNEPNPYRVRKVYGRSYGSKRQIAKYGDLLSVICFLRDFYLDGMDVASLPEIREWVRRRTVG